MTGTPHAERPPAEKSGGAAPRLLAWLAVIVATALAVAFASQLPLDRHSFRQTQTALTAYWFMQEGYRLIYETPVGGYPWAIPFEFPLYQWIIAGLSQALGAPVATVGRLVSFGFLLACIPPVWSINRRLALPGTVFAFFVALTFTTPVYVYWGRAVLIETAALFFTLAGIKFALDYLLGQRSVTSLLLFSAAMTLSLLQKVTTGLPVLFVLGVLVATTELKSLRQAGRSSLPRLLQVAVLFGIPLAAGWGWTHVTDFVKEQNPLGQALTSAALSSWNWGTPAQRFSSDLWIDVILLRIFVTNLGAVLGAGAIVLALAVPAERRVKAIIALATLLGMLPLFLFTNLHIVHDYYQTSNIMFLVYAVAVALGAVIAPRYGERTALVLAVGLMIANMVSLVKSGYLAAMTQSFGRDNADVAVGEILKRELPAGGQFVAFGNDYSSTFAFLSGRKSFGVPPWFKDIDKALANPADYVEKGRLGAVVYCGDKPDAWQLADWAAAHGGWKVGETAGCGIAVPPHPFAATPVPGACRGDLQLTLAERGGRKAVKVDGWSAAADAPEPGGEVYLAFASAGAAPLYVETLRVPRLDANEALGVPPQADLGISRLLTGSLAPGDYTVTMVQQRAGGAVACPVQTLFHMP